ncbi:hypothetical protein [Streptomyces sp. NPDC057910]|uniref:hypothetical protein n=1 Tax=Streptomyces sp. NPDC057910 TaxID=3346278 RepID=UPI0036EAA0A6
MERDVEWVDELVHAELLGAYWMESSPHESPRECQCGLSRPVVAPMAGELEVLRSAMVGFAAGTVVVAAVMSLWGR